MKEANNSTWMTLAILMATQFVMSMGAFSFGPLAPFFRDTLGISRGEVGSLIAVFYFTATLAAVPAGIFVDRLGARPLLILCLFLEGIPYGAMSFAESFVTIGICSALSGIGYGFINQVSTKGIMNWFAPAQRGTAMGIKQSGVTFGAAGVAWLLPLLAVAYSWQIGVGVVGLSMFSMALISFLFYREHPPDAGVAAPRISEDQGGPSLRAVLSQPTLLALMLTVPFLAFSNGCAVSFLVLYLKEQVQLPVELAGQCMTASMIAAAVGRVSWGMMSDRLFAGDRLQPVIIVSVLGAVSALGTALLTPSSALGLIFFWSILLGFSLSGWNGLVMVLSAELGGRQRAASVVSVVITVLGMGFLSGTLVFGIVADHAGYFPSWLLVVVTSLCSVAGFVRVAALQRQNRRPCA